MKLPPAGRCVECGGVLTSVDERQRQRCWICQLELARAGTDNYHEDTADGWRQAELHANNRRN